MSELKVLDHIRRRAIEDHVYFSNKNKQGRERYVASLFLETLGLYFGEGDFLAQDQSNIVDICLDEFRFQIKELMDEGFRRGNLYRGAREAAERASCLAELSLVSECCRDVPHTDTSRNLLLNKMPSVSTKYAIADRAKTDLLVYATRTRAALFREEELAPNKFSTFGWRSVSCVNEKQAVVLSATDAAPAIIRQFQGQVVWKREVHVNDW